METLLIVVVSVVAYILILKLDGNHVDKKIDLENVDEAVLSLMLAERDGKYKKKPKGYHSNRDDIPKDNPIDKDNIDRFLAEKSKYFNSDAWKTLRRRIRKRDGNQCVLCGTSKKQLAVHHKTYERFGNEDEDDLVTLCKDCHTDVHNTLGFPDYATEHYKTQWFWSDELEDIRMKNLSLRSDNV